MPPRAPLARAAALCALTALTTLAHAQELCDSVQIGNETRTAFSLAERRVEPDMFALEISEPDVCPDTEAVGLKVTACDREQAPRVLLLDTARGVVARSGPAASTAFVYVTVYCADADEPGGDAADFPSVPSLFSEQELPLPLPEVEPSSVQDTMDDYLPPVKLESRFSSLDQPPIPTSLTSMLNNLLKKRATPSLGQLGTAPRLTKNWPDTSSLVKRLSALRPKQPSALVENRSPAWQKQPARRPPSPWLKLRSLPDVRTRKSMSRSRSRPAYVSYDYGDAWSPYDDGPLYLHWSEEQTDPISWNREDEHIANRPASHSKHPQHGNTGTHSPLLLEYPSPPSITHISKKQNRYVPPIHEDPALLAEWKKELHRSPRPSLPKLLLLLQEQDRPAPIHRDCDSAHSTEDAEQLWAHLPYQDNTDDSNPWQPDYPTDYSADDGDPWSHSPKHDTDEMYRGQYAYLAPTYLEEPEHGKSAWCLHCKTEHAPEHAHVPLYGPAPEHAHVPLYGPAPEHAHTPQQEHAAEYGPVPEHAHGPLYGPAPEYAHVPLYEPEPEHAHTPQYEHAAQYGPVPEHAPHHGHATEHAHTPEHSPEHAHDAHRLPHAEDAHSVDYFNYYDPNPHTERPMLTSTVRHSLAWVKSSHAATHKPHMNLNQATHEPAPGEPTEQPWTFLSRLLLSHPTFRDSTHVIRIR